MSRELLGKFKVGDILKYKTLGSWKNSRIKIIAVLDDKYIYVDLTSINGGGEMNHSLVEHLYEKVKD